MDSSRLRGLMAANVGNSKTGEISMLETKRSGDVVVMVSGQEKDVKNSPRQEKDVKNSPRRLSSDSHFEGVKFVPMGTPSPENARFAPSPNRPPKIPTKESTAPRKALARSVYSKPKSRFGEQPISVESYMLEEDSNFMQDCLKSSGNSPARNMSTQASPNSRAASAHNSFKDMNRNVSINTPRTPLMASPGGVIVDEDEEIYKKVSNRNKLKYKKVKIKVLIDWIVFLVILGSLISCLTIDKLEHTRIWGLELWKWSLLVMVTFSGMLFTTWFMHFVVLVIEMNYLFRKKVLYFVHGLKKSAQVCLWWTLILITWLSLFNNGVHRSATATKVLDYITWTIVSVLICSFLWLFKTLLLKVLASSFHVTTFFDRVQESIFHQYVLQVLSGPPLMAGRADSGSQFSFRSKKIGKKGKEDTKKAVIDINKLHQIKQEKVSAWTMKILVDVISNSGLSTISSSLDETDYYGNNEQTDKEITSEMEAIAAAYHIYSNVAQPGSMYIYELDLRRFMLKEEVDLVFPLIDVAEMGQIDKKALTEWVVKVYNGRKALAHALNDTKTAVKQLNTLVTVILIVIVFVVWLLLVEIATTKVLLFLSSQLVAAAFLFGNTCKTIFEAIIFVFVMHPFDVGDRCVIDGVQMIVEEMNILTTVFLRYDMEKIYYPNSVLATKPISNFYRSPDMGDSLEFSICFTTPVEKIGSLREKIKKYLERTPQYWHPNHNLVVKEIENVNKIKMALFFNHTMNFQEFGEKNRRRSELVIEMKKIFEELGIKYNLLPQEVQVVNSDAAR
ncbi:mechanosensitive ion channel protein 10 isoform X2 [Daucus carota subsp. sativus]|uniref:mechanosensitive ion channel protein 10 isoform X2 n=1 Tax=Daucus carota subsp. sativus TaxID=79200 RepID=UPI0007EF1D8A|nr:PREDICTED: mechanosensitive ion channel protein 10-like isoform X2 [Daucus carota subsp. sativus]